MEKRRAAVSVIKQVEENKGELFKEANIQLVLDYSGSMDRHYRNRHAPVTTLAEQVLALALERLDPDGIIPLWLFGFSAYGPYTVTDDNLHPRASRGGLMRGQRAHEGAVKEAIRRHQMGSTNLADAIRKVTDYHVQDTASSTIPGLVVVQTDGLPDSEDETVDEIVRASHHNLFFAFVGYGRQGSSQMTFLKRLDRGGFPGQVVDNCSVTYLGDEPWTVSDEDVYQGILSEIPEWRRKAAGKVQGAV